MYLTRAEAAERLGVSERTVDRYIRRGLLRAKKGPVPVGSVHVHASSVDRLLSKRECV